MEESPYVPSPIPPALVVFSGSGYGDAIRMQRPFGSQVSDGKELNLPNLSPSSFGLRPMESPYPGLPASLVHLQNHPFLHPALEARLPFGSSVGGAFRPVGSSADRGAGGEKSFPPPPSHLHHPGMSHGVRRKLDSIVESVLEHQQNRVREFAAAAAAAAAGNSAVNLSENKGGFVNGQQGRHRSLSPPVRHSPKASDGSPYDDRDENGSPNSDISDRSTPEESHVGQKRKRKSGPEIGCPVCNLSLRPLELEAHLLTEVEQLMCMSRLRRQQPLEPSADSPSNKKDSAQEGNQDSRWETYHRVRANRHSRLRLKSRRRREESGGGGPGPPHVHVTCPVCQMSLQSINEQLSAHVEACLRKNGEIGDEDEPVDIEGDGDLEDYDWTRRRVERRPSTLQSYSVTALNMTTTSRRREEENDELVVDGDEESTFPHYTADQEHPPSTSGKAEEK